MTNYYRDMFQVPFLHLDVENWEDKKDIILSSFNINIHENDEDDEVSTDYFYKVETKNNVDIDNKFISTVLESEINNFSNYFNFSSCEILLTWFQKSIAGQQHIIHNHGSLGYSAVCYVEYDPKFHKPTTFVSPFNNFIDGTALIYEPEQIREGSIVFFPSSIHHYAPPNNTNIRRTILALNLKVK